MKNLEKTDNSSVSRRAVLQTLGASSALIAASTLTSASALAKDSASHSKSLTGDALKKAILEACSHCKQTSNVCIDHCIALVANDDTSIAACLAATRALLPVLDATISLVSADSKHQKAMVSVCLELCNDCRVECEKHAHHHGECKACMESCEQCIATLKKV